VPEPLADRPPPKRSGTSTDVSVLVADSMPLVTDSLALALGAFEGLFVLPDRPATGLSAIEAVAQAQPAVALIDYWMPDMEGAAVASLIASRRHKTKVIMMSWFFGTREIQNSLDAGAVGFFPKTLSVGRVAEGILRAQAGESPVYLNELDEVFRNLSQRSAASAEAWARLEGLTNREVQILAFLATDLTVEDIGKQLAISPQTVRVHIRNLVAKTNTGSYKETLNLARRCGLIRN